MFHIHGVLLQKPLENSQGIHIFPHGQRLAKKLALSQGIGGVKVGENVSEALLDSCTRKGSHRIVIVSKLGASPCPKRCASHAQADCALSPQTVDVSQKHARPYCTNAAEQSQQLNKLTLESAKSYPC